MLGVNYRSDPAFWCEAALRFNAIETLTAV
jgi:hypothetical protein